jgi:hypothetical protein
MTRSLPITVVLAVLWLSAAATGAEEIVISADQALAPSQPAIALERARLETSLRIANTGDRERSVTLIATKLIEQDSKADATTTWTLLRSPQAVLLADRQAVPSILAPNTSYTIRLAADIPQAGVYRGELRILEEGKEIARHLIQVNRTIPPVDANTLAWTRGTYLSDLVRPRFLRAADIVLPLTIFNSTSRPVELRSFEVESVTEKIASQENAIRVGVGSRVVACTGSPILLEPASGCRLDIVLSNLASAGEFTVKLLANGLGGGRLEIPLTLKIRYSWLYAALAIALGAAAGFIVRQWRTRDRAVAVAFHDLALTVQALERLERLDGSSAEIIDAALNRAKALQIALYTGTETQLTAVEPMKRRAAAVRQWVDYERIYRGLQEVDRQAVAVRHESVLRLLQDAGSDAVALTKSLAEYAEQLEVARSHSMIRAPLAALDSRRKELTEAKKETANGQPTPLAKAAEAALAALVQAHEQLDKPDLPAATEALHSAQRKMADYLAQKPRLESTTADATPEKVDLVVPPLPPFLPFALDAAPETVWRRILAFDRIANLLGAVFIILIGVQVLWVGALTWGTFGDWVTALTSGAALQFGYGSTITELRTQFRPLQ